FNRGTAAEVGHDLLSRAIACSKPFQAVYATTDAMAFGLVDVNAEIMRRYGCQGADLFSYDGLPEIRAMIAEGRISGTVIQDASALARYGVNELLARLFDLGKPRPVIWVPPNLSDVESSAIGSVVRPFDRDRAEWLDQMLRAFALSEGFDERQRKILL